MNKILIGLGLGCPQYKEANLYDKVKSPFNIQEFLNAKMAFYDVLRHMPYDIKCHKVCQFGHQSMG